jgi:hypothetical protein
MRRRVVSVLVVFAIAVLLPYVASAQASISGLVQDATGAVLPGVTVEAASPALIERSRTVVTDAAGRYTVVDLRPGTYSVSFSLPGFSTVKHDGIALEGAATVQVNSEMRVGGVEESITVSGQTPVVDTQNTRRQFIVNREMLDVLPASRSFQARAVLIPGVANATFSGAISLPTVHGSSQTEAYTYNDGMRASGMNGDGNIMLGWALNDAASAELTFETGSQTAEMQVGGVLMNAIPKEGGNTFSGTWFTYGAGGGLQSDNRTPELREVIQVANRIGYTFETNPAFGGPIIRNKLWFFSAGRATRTKNYVADVFFPDGSQAHHTGRSDSALARLTYQMTQRNKLRVSFDKLASSNPRNSVGNNRHCCQVDPRASWNIFQPQNYNAVAKWTSTVTNRVLFEAAVSTQYNKWMHRFQPEVGPYEIANVELTTSKTTVAALSSDNEPQNRSNVMAKVSYVTGSHNFKAGVDQQWGYLEHYSPFNGDSSRLNFFNGVPISVAVLNTPIDVRQEMHADLGVFAQDVWTVNRLTLNLGLRYDHFNAGTPVQEAPAGRFVPARRFEAIQNVPNWNDWALRAGAAYDLFGNGKTALKAYVGKYVGGETMTLVGTRNPMNLKSETRSWRDLDGNRSILDANGTLQAGEIGPALNSNFGLDVGTTLLDPNLPRDGNWEQNVLIQHQLRQGFGVTAGYYRRQYYKLQRTDNLAVDPDRDYTPFTITAPLDPRLPNGGGEVITLYNLRPEKLGAVDNMIVASANTRTYDGFEATFSARLRNDAFLMGGVTTERSPSDTCEVDNPNQRRFCDLVPPFRTMFKVSGSYRLPYDVQFSGMWQVMPGGSLSASYSVNSALAGVPLTGGGTLSVQLLEPNTMFYDYGRQLDLRLMRWFRKGRFRAAPMLDIYNVLNASTVTAYNLTFGASWLRPAAIREGRFLRLGAQMDF